MPKVSAQYKERVRQRIAASGFAIFSKNGYRGTSMDDIARAVGVSKGNLYLYYPRKVDLLKAVQLETQRQSREWLRAALESADRLEALVQLFDRATTMIEHQAAGALWLELITSAKSDPELGAALAEDQAEDRKVIRSFLREAKRRGELAEGLSVDSASVALTILYVGAVLQVTLGVPPRAAREGLRAGLRGLFPP